MTRKNFFLNALVLTASLLFLRASNIGFRIYLAQEIGAAGMGLYQLILSAYLLPVTVCTSGLSLAATRLTAEALGSGRPGRAGAAMRRCFACAACLSLPAAAGLYFFSEFIGTEFLGDPRAAEPLRILAPSLPFLAVSSCLKGYFIAMREGARSVSGETLEQLVTIGIAVGIFTFSPPLTLENACCAVMLASTLGEAFSFACNWTLYRREVRRRSPERGPGNGLFRRLVHIALPAACGYTARNLLSAAENVLIPRGLKAGGASAESALSLYGLIQGMVLPLLYFPSAVLGALASLLIPEVSRNSAAGRDGAICRITARSLQMALLFSFFIAGVFWGFSEEFGLILYRNRQAGTVLRVLAPLVPLMYLDGVVDAILKGLDQQVSSLKYNFSDSCIRVILSFFLIPPWGIKGYLCVLFFSTVYNASLSIHRLIQVSQVPLRLFDWVLKPLVCSALSVLLLLPAGRYLPLPAQQLLLFQGMASGALYCLFLRLSGAFSRSDAKWLRGIFR